MGNSRCFAPAGILSDCISKRRARRGISLFGPQSARSQPKVLGSGEHGFQAPSRGPSPAAPPPLYRPLRAMRAGPCIGCRRPAWTSRNGVSAARSLPGSTLPVSAPRPFPRSKPEKAVVIPTIQRNEPAANARRAFSQIRFATPRGILPKQPTNWGSFARSLGRSGVAWKVSCGDEVAMWPRPAL